MAKALFVRDLVWLRTLAPKLAAACETANDCRDTVKGRLDRFSIHPYTFHTDGLRMETMVGNLPELRAKAGDSEKITINLGYVDLGQIDLLVEEGFYSNRTDLIRTAIRNQIERHTESVKRAIGRRHFELGLRRYSREDLEAVRAAGETLHIHVLGLASIADDVPPELARQTIASIRVLGALQLNSALKAALEDRIH